MRQFGVAGALLCMCIAGPAAARADSVTVDAGLALNFLNGKHDTGTGVDRLNYVPLPLAEVDARFRGTALHLEALPPVTFGYGDGAGGTQATRLSIITVSVRHALGAGVYAGLGQTIYNQRTTYDVNGPQDVAAQSSRVTGTRFELGFEHRLVRRTRIDYVFAVNPAMRGVEHTQLAGAAPGNELRNPERAVQVDTALRLMTKVGPGELVYGLRYLNYASRYDLRGLPFDGLLADRNVGLMPILGYRARL